VDTDERWDDDPRTDRIPPSADFAWGRTANPNTADGELQNIAAFGAGLARLTGHRRRAAVIVVWLILTGFVIGVLFGVIGIVAGW
jgi:hypothetical protein